jgi:hypothetical protein
LEHLGLEKNEKFQNNPKTDEFEGNEQDPLRKTDERGFLIERTPDKEAG